MPDPVPIDPSTARRRGPWFFAGLLALYAVLALAIPPRLFWDSAKGFEIWWSMERGGPFNGLTIPDSGDITKDTSTFIVWWSPGQYLVPGALLSAGVPSGVALTLVTLLCHAFGLWGWHRVWRALGFDERTVWWSCAILVTQGFFIEAFAVYHGGEALLFGFLPWALLLALRWRDRPFYIAAALPLAIAAGAFFKTSFLLFAAILVAACAWREVRRAGEPLPRRAGRVGALAAGAALGLALLWWSFYSRGATPASTGERPWSFLDVLAPLANPWVAALEGTQPRDWIEYPSGAWGALLPVVAAAGAWILLRLYRRHRGTEYGTWLSFALLLYLGAFLVLYALKSHVDYTARHLRPLGLLLLPGMALEFREGLRREWRMAGLAVLAAAHLYCAGINAILFAENARAPRASPYGYSIPRIGASALAALQRMDAACAGSNALFALSIPEARGATPHVRFVHFPIEAASLEQIRATAFRGRTEHLLIALPLALDGRARAVAAAEAFEGYQRWRIVAYDGWIFCSPSDDEVLARALEQAATPR
ncbi:MAG: hypothetical protein HY291_18390 [Planctomycetes bacterium]|nr:hypothetical protein [Planctomycetota bacterium]